MKSQGDGWSLSLLAGAAGIAVCVGLLLVGYYELPQFAYLLAIPLAISSGGTATFTPCCKLYAVPQSHGHASPLRPPRLTHRAA